MEALARSMNAPARNMDVFARYLAEEAALRLPDVDLQVRARFHRIVLQAALAWRRHPKTSFKILRSRHTLALAFEGPVEGKPLTLFTFRSACETGDYRFLGFSPNALPQGLSPNIRAAMQRLRELYEAALPQAFQQDGAVGVVIRKLPAIDFLPIVDESRRVLDEGNQDFPPVDLRELQVVPAEHARLYYGKTTVVPIVRPKVEPPPAAAAPAPAKVATNGHHPPSKTAANGVAKAKPAAPPAVAPVRPEPRDRKAAPPKSADVAKPAAAKTPPKPAMPAKPATPAKTSPPQKAARPAVAKTAPAKVARPAAKKPPAPPAKKPAAKKKR